MVVAQCRNKIQVHIKRNFHLSTCLETQESLQVLWLMQDLISGTGKLNTSGEAH
jgi:hypothetical protein